MKNLMVRTLVAILVLQALFLASPATVYAHEGTCPTPWSVQIDVKPVDDANKINLSARGVLPVAVLSTEDFDASLFTPVMAHLSDASLAIGCAGAMAIRWAYSDVNNDGRLDLVFFFRIQDLNLTSTSTEVMLMAHGTYGSTEIHIEGMDTVQVIP